MRVSVQSRITTTMVIFVIVLISAFTLIQAQNQLRSITIFNSLKAKMTAQILKNSLKEIIRQTPPGKEQISSIADVLTSMKDSGLIEAAFVYSINGQIGASTQSALVGTKASDVECLRIKEAEASSRDKGFGSYVDKTTRALQLYIPIFYENKISYVARIDISLGNIGEAAKQVYIPVIVTAFVVITVNILLGIILSKQLIGPISLLDTATKEIAAGDLNLRIHINTNDELQDMAETFNSMAVELKKMKAKAENANPLTKLPGNVVIQEEIQKRINNSQKFTVIYCDLDYFKAFNDKYGIERGDEAIKLAASIFKEAIAQKGNPADDFIGHEGGDDFMLLTTPDKAKGISDYIIAQFEQRIRALYKKEDLDRGYIMAHARQGNEIIKFPIMTISLAGVTNETRTISSYGEVTNIAAEVKCKAKQIGKSCFVLDQRKTPWPPPEGFDSTSIKPA